MAESSDDYNAKVVGEFRANGGRVGGIWEETPLLLLHHTGGDVRCEPRQPSRVPARRWALLHLGCERRSAEAPSLVSQPQGAPGHEDRGQ